MFPYSLFSGYVSNQHNEVNIDVDWDFHSTIQHYAIDISKKVKQYGESLESSSKHTLQARKTATAHANNIPRTLSQCGHK